MVTQSETAIGWSHTGIAGPFRDDQPGLPQKQAGLRHTQPPGLAAPARDCWFAPCLAPTSSSGLTSSPCCGRPPDACGLSAQLRLRPSLPPPARTCYVLPHPAHWGDVVADGPSWAGGRRWRWWCWADGPTNMSRARSTATRRQFPTYVAVLNWGLAALGVC